MDRTELEMFKSTSLRYCDKLIREIKSDMDDIETFFGGELYKAYASATDKVLREVTDVRRKIRNL